MDDKISSAETLADVIESKDGMQTKYIFPCALGGFLLLPHGNKYINRKENHIINVQATRNASE